MQNARKQAEYKKKSKAEIHLAINSPYAGGETNVINEILHVQCIFRYKVAKIPENHSQVVTCRRNMTVPQILANNVGKWEIL